jgi:hypothetical protein
MSNPSWPPGSGKVLELQVRRRGRGGRVEAQLEPSVGGRVDAVAIAGVGQKLARAGEIVLAKGVLVVRVVAEDAGRQQRLSGHAATVQEQLEVLAGVDGYAHGLTQLAAALAGCRAHHRVLHVEADVADARLHRLVQAHAPCLHLRRQPVALDHGVEALLDDAAVVIVALQQLVEARNVFPLAVELDAVDEGHAPSRVCGIDAALGNVRGVDLHRENAARRIEARRLACRTTARCAPE